MSETSGPAVSYIIAQADVPAPGAGVGTEAGAHEAGGVSPWRRDRDAGRRSARFELPAVRCPYVPSQLIWFAIAFGALYLLMSRIALPRIANILEERHDRIADDREEAARLTAESEAAAAAYEKALASARGKAQGIAGETRDKLAAEAETKRKSLESDLSAKLSAAEAQISATKRCGDVNVRGIAIDAAGAIVNELVGEAPAAHAVEAAVDTAIKS